MYLKYGNYQHAAGECTLTGITRQTAMTPNGIAYAIRERWNIMGRLQIADQGTPAANQAAMTVALNALIAAYKLQGRDLGFYDDAGNLTSHVMRTSQTESGVAVIQQPSFPIGKGAEYSTFRTYTMSLEGSYSIATGSLISWAESVSIRGTGGPVWGFLQPLTGSPQQQLFSQSSTVIAVQRGSASAVHNYPSIPSPLWPGQEHEELRDVEHVVPADNSGQRTIKWSYTMEFDGPVYGRPRVKLIN